MKRIYCYTYGFNEIEMLPLKKKWCDFHGITMRYFDNESTDGSKEWAIQNGVFVDDIFSNGAFDLRLILPVLNEDLIFEKPDWFCMLGVDLFIAPLNKDVRINEYLNFSTDSFYECDYVNVCYTGTEKQNGDLREFDRAALYGQYSMAFPKYSLLVRYENGVHMAADKIHFPENYTQSNDHFWSLINFGHTKTAAERNETFKRRSLAWDRGLNKNAGGHYRTGKALSWTYPKSNTRLICNVPNLNHAHLSLMEMLYE